MYNMENELWTYLKSVEKPVILYGMGNGADKIIKVLESYGIEFDGVFASDGFVREKYFHGKKIMSYSEIKKIFPESVVLLCFGSARPEVIENVLRIAGEQELYAPEVPVIGSGLFTKEFYEENKEKFEFVYSRLADDLSRKTFENIINFKLSGKIKYLFDCQVSDDEPYESFLKLDSNETYLDLGAYNGDTVIDFKSRVKDYNRIIAAEPDTKNFKKLVKNTEAFKNTECCNVAISNYCGEAPFSMNGGRNSCAGGEKTVMFSSVDNLVKDSAVTYIKMDLEGEEENAIKGALNTIKKNKPKMLISAYHRTDDFIKLPEAVFGIRNDYKLYIRHFKSLPDWDTNFYFI